MDTLLHLHCYYQVQATISSFLVLVSCSCHNKLPHTRVAQNNRNLLSASSGGREPKISITGLKSRCVSRAPSSRGCQGECGCWHFWICGFVTLVSASVVPLPPLLCVSSLHLLQMHVFAFGACPGNQGNLPISGFSTELHLPISLFTR